MSSLESRRAFGPDRRQEQFARDQSRAYAVRIPRRYGGDSADRPVSLGLEQAEQGRLMNGGAGGSMKGSVEGWMAKL